MARWLVLVLVVLSSSAHAGPGRADAEFAAWVKSRAKQLGAGIERWGLVQLDDDAALERMAVLCTGDADKATVLVEKSLALRWSFTREVDGRNGCRPEQAPAWSTKPARGIEVAHGYHHGSEARTVALRRESLEVVLIKTEEMNLPRDCSEETVDFDTLVRLERHCTAKQPTSEAAWPRMTPLRKAALFLIDGASGSYRDASASAPALSVAATTLGQRARIAVTLSRAAEVGDAVELWTVAASGQAMAWVATFGGAGWTLARQGHAPRELPEVTGDATQVAVPVLRRDHDEPSAGTPLCVAWHSASRSEHVATCELDTSDARSFGRLYTARRPPPDDLRAESR